MPTAGRFLLLALVGVAFVIQMVGAGLLDERHPQLAAALRRHWVWLPIVGLVGLITWIIGPIGLLFGVLAVGVVASRPDVFGLPPR